MICCASSTVPSCLFVPGKEAKPFGHRAEHQPSTWAKRGTGKSKAQVGFGQSRQGSQAHTNAEGSLLLHLLPVTLLLSAGQIVSDVFFSAPTWGEHPFSSQGLAKLQPSCTHTPSPWEPLKPALTVPSHPAAFAAIYSPTTPRRDCMGYPSPRNPPDLGCWPLSVLLQNSPQVAE